MFDQRVAIRFDLNPAHVDEAALGIAAHRMFDLDHVRAPISEDAARGGDEGELCDFKDAHALHYLSHENPELLLAPCQCAFGAGEAMCKRIAMPMTAERANAMAI